MRERKGIRGYPRILKNPRQARECQVCGEMVASGRSCIGVSKGKRVHHECFKEWNRMNEMEEENGSQ
jgi:hypothetical protein